VVPAIISDRSRWSQIMLVNCVAYQDGRKIADIAKEEIGKYVKRPDCFVWVALFEPSVAELREMRQEFDLHELAVEDASHGHQRPKLEEYGDSCVTTFEMYSTTCNASTPASRAFATCRRRRSRSTWA
jgi:Mg2+ and Co2+ transporter CorA